MRQLVYVLVWLCVNLLLNTFGFTFNYNFWKKDNAFKDWLINEADAGQYLELFENEGFNSLEQMDPEFITRDELSHMGIKKSGDQIKILQAIASLQRAKQSCEANDNSCYEHHHSHHKHHHHGPKHKVSLIFLGETGVGKTTLLQSIEDFMNNVRYENIEATAKPKQKGKSQTQIVRQFQLNNYKWAVNIIDTPGIGDVDGIQKDEQHLGNITEFIGNYGEFNAVCILIKRGTTRLTARMKYVINEIKLNMPKDVEDNFIIIMTRSEIAIPDSDTMAVIKSLKLPTQNIIPINNGAYEELDMSEIHPDNPLIEIVERKQRIEYAENHKNLELLLETAFKMKLYQGDKMLKLKLKRDELKEQVGLLTMKVEDTWFIQKNITEAIANINAATSAKELNRLFKTTQSVPKFTEYKETGKISTACRICGAVCHINCGLGYGDDLNGCTAAGSNGKCKHCGHSMANHYHLGWKRKEEWEDIVHINDTMKLKWEEAGNEKEKLEKIKKGLENKLIKLKKERKRIAKYIQQKYYELEQLAIIGYNEDFESYIEECKKSVEDDDQLTRQDKEGKISYFHDLILQYRLLMAAAKGTVDELVENIAQ